VRRIALVSWPLVVLATLVVGCDNKPSPTPSSKTTTTIPERPLNVTLTAKCNAGQKLSNFEIIPKPGRVLKKEKDTITVETLRGTMLQVTFQCDGAPIIKSVEVVGTHDYTDEVTP
jgi:hypothetical protein